MSDATGTNRAILIAENSSKLWKLVLLGAFMICLALPAAFRWYSDIELWSFEHFMGIVGVILFGLGFTLFAFKLVRSGRPMLEISSFGLTDLATRANAIPWSAIRNATIDGVAGQTFLCLELDPQIAKTVSNSQWNKLVQKGNRYFGYGDYAMPISNLAIDHRYLLELVQKRIAESRDR